MRLLTLTLFIGLFLVPAPAADAGPLQRLRERVQQRNAPNCANGVCQLPARPVTAQPVPKVAQQPAPKVVEGPIRDAARLKLLRILAVNYAVEHGVPAGDGSVKKVTRAHARALAEHVTDEQITKGLRVYGAPSEGRLEDFFDWVLAHREEIAELVKWIVSLFALFADEPN